MEHNCRGIKRKGPPEETQKQHNISRQCSILSPVQLHERLVQVRFTSDSDTIDPAEMCYAIMQITQKY
jgi:hypothetical protein